MMPCYTTSWDLTVAVLVPVKEQTWKVAVGTRGKEGQRVVPPPPAVADPQIALDEFEAGACSAKVIADRQSGLTRTDDEDVQNGVARPNGGRHLQIGQMCKGGHQSSHGATVPSVDPALIEAAT